MPAAESRRRKNQTSRDRLSGQPFGAGQVMKEGWRMTMMTGGEFLGLWTVQQGAEVDLLMV